MSEPNGQVRSTSGERRTQVPPLARRVLIIGLDGATFDVLEPMMARGRMPRLAALVQGGASGVLNSTLPPVTPAAWTTFMTGKGPGRHGIVDFERYDLRTNRLIFNSTIEIREKTMWEILSERGFRVGSINLPMTYPPKKVNGFMISGFDAPSLEADFTYPSHLKDELLRRFPEYTHAKNWQRRTFGGDRLFAENLTYIRHSFEQGVDLAEFCGQQFGWDVMMVLLKLVDNLQHKAWRYLDTNGPVDNRQRATMVAECFTKLDETIGRLAEFGRRHEALVMVMSDHGHGSLDGKAQPNLLLRRWGYLKLQSAATRALTRGAYWWSRVGRRYNGRARWGAAALETELAVDWRRTTACVLHAGICGFLYLNVKGRQPQGIVEPDDYETLRSEIRDRLLALRSRDRGGRLRQVFAQVHRTEELYECRREEQEWLPDLLLVPTPGLAVVRKIRGFQPVRWLSPRRKEGTHRVEGMLVVSGAAVRAGTRLSANIVDVTPTLLAVLGLRVPADMEGHVLTEIFDPKPTVEFEPPHAYQFVQPTKEAYTEEEKRALTERLADLGYLE
jgi:predicted AlkP superfamily phosphohydrolase/phosphomutase